MGIVAFCIRGSEDACLALIIPILQLKQNFSEKDICTLIQAAC